MADKIRVNTELLERCAGELRTTAQGFGSAASILAGLDTGKEWWTKMGRFDSIRLQDEGSSVPSVDAGATVRALTAVLRRYDNRMTSLGNRVSQTAGMFDNLENSLHSRAINQYAGTEGDIIGAPGDAGGISGGAAGNDASGSKSEDDGWLGHIREMIVDGGVIAKGISSAWGIINDIVNGKVDFPNLAKYAVDGRDIVTKWLDINKRYKKLSNFGKSYANKLKWRERLGLNKFWNGKTAATRLSQASSGLDRFKANFSKQFVSGMKDKANWITSGISSAINNYNQHKEGLKTGAVKIDRVGVEWVTESVGTVTIGAASTALAAAGFAAVGAAGAPVIAVGVAAYGISCAADWAFKGITGSEKGIAETVGDAAGEFYDKTLKPGVIQGAKKIGEGMEKMGNWLSSKVKAAWSW